MRTVKPIVWPCLDARKVAAYRRLGRGIRFVFQAAGEPAELVLEPGLAPETGVSHSFESQCGVLTLSNAGPLLSLFGECPVVLADAGNDPHSWFWAHFEQRMSTQLSGLLGYLRPLAVVQQGDFECRVSVVLGQSRSVGRLMMAPENLLKLYDAGGWQAIRQPLPEAFVVPVPVVLGSLRLAIEQLRGVRIGDVLVPEQPPFSAEGVGWLSIGRLRLQVQIDDEGGRRSLSIGSIEESAVDEVQCAGTEVAGFEGEEPFEALLVDLSVRCGALKLSLGELRQLAPGMVLNIDGYGTGMAGLYYGDRAVGLGQLVEVDGRLGLQLSRINFSQ